MPSQQIQGIMSNLDTQSIVQALMQSESQGLARMQSDQQAKTNQMSVYNTISAKLIALNLQASKLAQLSTFDAATVDVSDEDYLAAAIKGKVAEGQYILTVNQLASNHQIASQGYDSENADVGTGTFTIQVGDGNSVNVTLDSGDNTLSALRDAINQSSAGVKAAIINDGSSKNSYRLLLTSSKSGASNQIIVTSNLTGGVSPDFENSSFDAPEKIRSSSSSTSAISLGASASYSGNENKTYTFTVQGSGTQLIGADAITINWSDGTNAGSFEIPSDYASGTEIALSGEGADGLTLSLGAGTLTGGDQFQVQSFSPTLQAARDARVTLGSTDSGGSPITVTSATNSIDTLIPGVSLNLKKVSDTQTPNIVINTSVNIDDIKSNVQSFIDSYNAVMDEIDKQFQYEEGDDSAGILFGDSTLLTIQNRLRSSMTLRLNNVEGEYKLLSQFGIRHSQLGKLEIADPSQLEEAIKANLTDVTKFFTNSANSDNSKISYNGSTAKTKMPTDGFVVNITNAASHGYLNGTLINDPELSALTIDDSNYKLKFRVDGVVSDDITLTQKTYNSLAELAAEIQSKIDQDAKIGSRGITVDYVDAGETGYLKITSSNYGEDSKVEVQAGIDSSAFTILGLARGETIPGTDVEGTINGEEAEGHGQILTGKEGNKYSDGLSLKVELLNSDISSGEPEAAITLVKGFATQINELVDMYSASGEGVIANRTTAIQRQIDQISDDMEREQQRLAIRQQSLYDQYNNLEQVLGQWNTTASYLQTQFSNLDANWKFNSSK